MEATSDRDKQNQLREIYRNDKLSNQVLMTDKRFYSNLSNPIQDAKKSHPKSMMGKISIKDMGASVRKTENESWDNEPKGTDMIEPTSDYSTYNTIAKSTQTSNSNKIRQSNTAFYHNVKYNPTDEANREIYQQIISQVTSILGDDLPHDIILDTTDSIIVSMCEDPNNTNDDGTMQNKKKEFESIFMTSISNYTFQTLVKLCGEISDYSNENDRQNDNDDHLIAVADSEEEEEVNKVVEVTSDTETDTPLLKSPTDTNKFMFEESSGDNLILSDVSSKLLDISLISDIYLTKKLVSLLPELTNDEITQLYEKVIIYAQSSNDESAATLENDLLKQLDFENYFLLDFLKKNKDIIKWGLQLSSASEDDKKNILHQIKEEGLDSLADAYQNNDKISSKRKLSESIETNTLTKVSKKSTIESNETHLKKLDLSKYEFASEENILFTEKVVLPEGSFKRLKPQYEEIHIPAPTQPIIDYELIPISALPDWATPAFPSNEAGTFNAIQSKVFDTAFNSDSNILLCAPTGAGKTNVAMLATLRALSHFRNSEMGKIDLTNVKIVYIAPLKALVQEQVREFQRRLEYLGISVSELTGDANLSKQEMLNTNILVATPEKWDIITRKKVENPIVNMVNLVIIDEIHLLHDKRGPVIESIVARSLRSNYAFQVPRIIGLSATLPNYDDVAKFLKVPKKGLFHFDASFRPCPLSQQFCGITEKGSIKNLNAQNIACYDKVLESVLEGHQVIVFVHSRKDTLRTASWLKEQFILNNHTDKLIKREKGGKEILISESNNIQSKGLKEVLKMGIGIHHAGLPRSDRSLNEDLFADGLLRVLVSTATLAWGVNLPAHTVIIKGTNIYSPEKGTWIPLSSQDMLQMLGRAGRPRYDNYGEGIIITNQEDIQYYLAVLNQQLPIESQMISSIVDRLNAEVVSKSVTTRKQAVDWLRYTYLYVRMQISPHIYNIPEVDAQDNNFSTFCESIIHTVLTLLDDCKLAIYDHTLGTVTPTNYGRISSYYYISHSSMLVFYEGLHENCSPSQVLRIFASAEEFQYITIRQEEQNELRILLDKSPIPITTSIDENYSKIIILLQAYISRFSLDGFALNTDMIFIIQNAGRLLGAMHEFCWRSGWSRLAKLLLNFSTALRSRMWSTNSPLRYFNSCPPEVIRRIEASNLPWKYYLSLTSATDVGSAIKSPNYGKHVFDLLQRFPKLNLECSIQPLTPSLVKLELDIFPDWIWDRKYHGVLENFIIFLEDSEGERLLYMDRFSVKENYIQKEHFIDFFVQLPKAYQNQLPPTLFLSVVSDKWWHCNYQLPISLTTFKLPKKFISPIYFDEEENVSSSSVNCVPGDFFPFKTFNKLISKVFLSVYESNENILVCASKDYGKTTIAELALTNHWRQNKGRAVYICPHPEIIDKMLHHLQDKFSNLFGGKIINKLESDLSINIKLLSQSHLLLATPQQFDHLTRRWRQRKNVQKIELIICDDIQEINNRELGSIYENIISRVLFLSTQLEKKIRIVSLGSCLANAPELGKWMEIDKSHIYNFSPQTRLKPVDIQIESYDIHDSAFSPAMVEKCILTAFDFYERYHGAPLIFLSSRQQFLNIFPFILSFALDTNFNLRPVDKDILESFSSKLVDKQIRRAVINGIGILYPGMDAADIRIISDLYEQGALSLLVATFDAAPICPTSKSAIILGTSSFNILEHRFSNYSVSTILEMVGCCSSDENCLVGSVLILTQNNIKDYYKKFLVESFPIESNLQTNIHEMIITELLNSVIKTKQDCVDLLTFSLFYHRIHSNPSYYGLTDTSAIGISTFLSGLVETAIQELQELSLVSINEKEEGATSEEVIEPLAGCQIASYNNISLPTMNLFIKSLNQSSTLINILETLSRASEFYDISFEEKELPNLIRISKSLPLKCSFSPYDEPIGFKVFVLLQSYFSNKKLSIQWKIDLNIILSRCPPLVSAIVDILSGDGCLNATVAMDLSQMLVQGLWDVDSPLKQIPNFSESILNNCKEKNIASVYDIMALEDDERENIITLSEEELWKTANFINNYPNIELKYHFDNANNVIKDSIQQINVTVHRDEEPESLVVQSSKFPVTKLENWWLVLGCIETGELFAIKKVTLNKETQEYKLAFVLPNAGRIKLTLLCVCDSYLDVDKEVTLDLNVNNS